jgi:YegS/Rv2252/BmrU family lipid kinase
VRTCVIFNPAARGDKARRFRARLDEIRTEAALKQTTAPGDARRLAREAVEEGFEVVVATGGDGTVNEVLNGIGDAPGGFERACLGVLPLGTVNVFARELNLPMELEPAWDLIRRAQETRIDIPQAEYTRNGAKERRYFAQMAGAGLDARAIELVQWQVKKRIGALAYVLAGLHAVLGAPCSITAGDGKHSESGGLVLIGNGRLYGGQFTIFPRADLRDGLLEVCVVRNVGWVTLARCTPNLLLRRTLPPSRVKNFQAASFTLTSPGPAPFHVDGELVGQLPASFSVQPKALRVIVPK